MQDDHGVDFYFLATEFFFNESYTVKNKTFGGAKVLVYNSIAIALNIFVNYFLLLTTAEILNIYKRYFCYLIAVIVLNAYNVCCLLFDFPMLLERSGYIVAVIISAAIAFGFTRASIRATVVFLFLNLGLWVCVCGFGGAGYWSVVACIVSLAVIYFICCIQFRPDSRIVKVAICFEGKVKEIKALRDTGNNLRDPLTGRPVMVIGADLANVLFGLTKQQLEHPIQSIQSNILPGLRLLPYSSIDNKNGMLLALKINHVKIGNRQGSCLVALAPQNIIGSGNYQALIGEDI